MLPGWPISCTRRIILPLSASGPSGGPQTPTASPGHTVCYVGGNCIAIFWPDVIPIPTQGAHFAYHWNGDAVDYVKRLDTGEVMRVE